jgi:hypothetical protein
MDFVRQGIIGSTPLNNPSSKEALFKVPLTFVFVYLLELTVSLFSTLMIVSSSPNQMQF